LQFAVRRAFTSGSPALRAAAGASFVFPLLPSRFIKPNPAENDLVKQLYLGELKKYAKEVEESKKKLSVQAVNEEVYKQIKQKTSKGH